MSPYKSIKSSVLNPNISFWFFAANGKIILYHFDQVLNHGSQQVPKTILKFATDQKKFFWPSRRLKIPKSVNTWLKWYSRWSGMSPNIPNWPISMLHNMIWCSDQHSTMQTSEVIYTGSYHVFLILSGQWKDNRWSGMSANIPNWLISMLHNMICCLEQHSTM